MRVLVGCEFSGVVRSAFREAGHDAYSCDFEPALDGSRYHYRCDVRDLLHRSWDLGIFHPPCTYLTQSANRWFYEPCDGVWGWERVEALQESFQFIRDLYGAPIPRVALENPIGKLNTLWQPPDQILQPWQFGHPEIKAICLWLKFLPPLKPTVIVKGRKAHVHRAAPGRDRWMERSIFYPGIAAAMVEQWGNL